MECVASCDSKHHVETSDGNICVDSCGKNNPEYNDGGLCSANCTSGFYTLSGSEKVCTTCNKDTQFISTDITEGPYQCLDTCQSEAFEDAANGYRQCATINNSRYYVKEQTKTGEGEKTYTHYYSSCPDGHKFHDEGMFECKENCGSKPYVQKSGDYVCVAQCGGSYPEYNDDGKCSDTCESKIYRTESSQKVCISESKCASKTFINGTMLECVEKCASFFVVAGEKTYCYGSCPSDHNFHDEGMFECKSGCDSKPYVPRSDGNICVA